MVVGIDHIDGLVSLSESNMRRGNPDFIERGDVCFDTRDGFLGAPDHGALPRHSMLPLSWACGDTCLKIDVPAVSV